MWDVVIYKCFKKWENFLYYCPYKTQLPILHFAFDYRLIWCFKLSTIQEKHIHMIQYLWSSDTSWLRYQWIFSEELW